MKTFLNGSSKETLNKKDPPKKPDSYFLKLDNSGVLCLPKMRSTVMALGLVPPTLSVPSNRGRWMQVNPRT